MSRTCILHMSSHMSSPRSEAIVTSLKCPKQKRIALSKADETVAVKILRPDVEARIYRDIAALRLGAKLAEGLFPKSRRLEPQQRAGHRLWPGRA